MIMNVIGKRRKHELLIITQHEVLGNIDSFTQKCFCCERQILDASLMFDEVVEDVKRNKDWPPILLVGF